MLVVYNNIAGYNLCKPVILTNFVHNWSFIANIYEPKDNWVFKVKMAMTPWRRRTWHQSKLEYWYYNDIYYTDVHLLEN